jgi:hypothetical protein
MAIVRNFDVIFGTFDVDEIIIIAIIKTTTVPLIVTYVRIEIGAIGQ